MSRYLSPAQRALACRLQLAGFTQQQIAEQVLVSRESVNIFFRSRRWTTGARSADDVWQPRAGRLTLADREEILVGLRLGWSFTRIARELCPPRAVSTVSREVHANGGRDGYSIHGAHRRAQEQTRRPKRCKLEQGRLLEEVTAGLLLYWSPQEIAARLRLDFPDEPEMRVSHETIYQSLFVQGRGELRRELARYLRSQRSQRKPQGVARPERIPGMVMLSERPAEAADRAVPGHWEGDLIIGKAGKSAVGTLVERSTRFVLLLHLAGDKTALAVEQAMREAITTLPAALMRSITWDQGSEMARHASFTLATGIPIYFCDPHSPWQRGSNENTNGLLRQFLPKGMDLSTVTPEELQHIADLLNGRPRQTLGWRTPSEELTRVLALTA